MADLIAAIWQGPFDAETPNGRTLHPGDESLVTDRDLESGHWARKPKPRAVKAEHTNEGDS